MRAVIATPLSINQGIAKYYGAGMRDEAVAEEALKKASSSAKKTATAKAKTKSTKKAATVRKRFRDLSEEEQHERRQFGYIIMCWATVGSVMLDQFVLKGHLFPFAGV